MQGNIGYGLCICMFLKIGFSIFKIKFHLFNIRVDFNKKDNEFNFSTLGRNVKCYFLLGQIQMSPTKPTPKFTAGRCDALVSRVL